MTENVQRKSIGPHFSMCVQPAFIIGTNSEDGSHNFAPITRIGITCKKDEVICWSSVCTGTK